MRVNIYPHQFRFSIYLVKPRGSQRPWGPLWGGGTQPASWTLVSQVPGQRGVTLRGVASEGLVPHSPSSGPQRWGSVLTPSPPDPISLQGLSSSSWDLPLAASSSSYLCPRTLPTPLISNKKEELGGVLPRGCLYTDGHASVPPFRHLTLFPLGL